MVFLEHRTPVYYSNTTAIEATALFVCINQHVKGKGRNYCRPRDPTSWPKMAATSDDCDRTATVALPTAASSGFISGEVGISAALDAFSSVYELPLMRFEIRQTDRQINRRTCTITIPRFTLRVTRGKNDFRRVMVYFVVDGHIYCCQDRCMNSENIQISILTGAEHYTLTQSPRKGYILITDLATTPQSLMDLC